MLEKFKFSIVKNYKIFFAINIIFLLIGFSSMIFRGFNLGIDFTGGSIMDLKFKQAVSVAQVRDVLKTHDLGNSIIQLESKDTSATTSEAVLIRTGVIDDAKRREVMTSLDKSLGKFDIQRVENVGATIGGELIQQAVMAIVLSWFLMIAYITLRFEFRFAIAAIIALIIDVSVTLSYFSLLHVEMDSSFVAALLTVVGYSINGTIVIFDRIREMRGLHPNDDFKTTVNSALNATLTRTINTSVSTLLPMIAIAIWGGESIRGLSVALCLGIIVGTYASIMIGTPIMYDATRRKLAKKQK